MPSFDAGSATGKYVLDISDAKKKIEELRKLYEGLAKLPASPGGSGTSKATSDEVKLAQALARTAEAEARRAAATARKAAEDAKAGIKTAQQATAEQKLAKETANAAAAQDRAAKTAIQLAKARDTAARSGGGGAALPRTFAGFTPAGLAQAAGFAFGPQLIGQIASFGVEQGKAALALRETENSLRAVAGSQFAYNKIIAEAKAQQVLFGGTLQENIDGLQGLAITARSSGAQLSTLVDLQKRLAVLDPSQGAAGARVALSEALSGDPVSLSKRYEIPRAALAKLRDVTIPVEERLRVIDTFLNGVGITSAAVAGKVDQDALAYRRLGAALEDTTRKVGDFLASGFAPAATSIANILEGKTNTAIRDFNSSMAQSVGVSKDQADALAKGKNAMQLYNEAVAAQYGVQIPNNQATADGAALTLRSADADDRKAAALANRTQKTQAQTDAERALANATGLADQRKGEQTGTTLTAVQFNNFDRLADAETAARLAAEKAAAERAAAEAKRLADLKLQNDLINARTSAQKIARLKQELAKTTDPIERQQLQNQIDQERLSTAKSYTSELGKQQQTQEAIYDSIMKQRDAALSLIELQIRDRQDSRKEARELAGLSRVVNGGQFSAEQKAAAQDKIDLIRVQQQQRQQKILETANTAGGAITDKGKLLQSQAGGVNALPSVGTAGGASPLPALPALGGGQTVVNINLNIDKNGAVSATSDPNTILNIQLAAARGQFATG